MSVNILNINGKTIYRSHRNTMADALQDAVKEGVSLNSAFLRGHDLSGVDLCNVRLRGSDLNYVNLSNANLRNADLSNSSICYVNLSNANLINTDLSYSRFQYSNLSGADLTNAICDYSDLVYADCSNSRLVGASVRYSDLRHANFYFADLGGIIAIGANLTGVSLTGAIISWDSHELISEILLQHAGQDVDKRMIAGMIRVSRDWCWKDFLRIDRDGWEWALEVLAKYSNDRDNSPNILRRIKSSMGGDS